MKRVFVNGAFDVLHPGHTRLLRHATTLGELTVGINSDESIRRLKGLSRPVFTEQERLEMLLSIRGVAEVIVFGENTPINLIRDEGPFDVIVKGSEYRDREIPERAAFLSIEFVFFDSGYEKHSTSVIDHQFKIPNVSWDKRCDDTAPGDADLSCTREQGHDGSHGTDVHGRIIYWEKNR